MIAEQNEFGELQCIVAYLYGLCPGGHASPQAKVNAPWELQSASGEELSALMPNIFNKAFKRES